MFHAIVLTLYPDMFPGPLGQSLAGSALESGVWQLETLNIRDFATDAHRTVDDRPYGGGSGMVMRPDILARAMDAAIERLPDARRIYFTPRGTPLTQHRVTQLKDESLILLCGRFEGVDERLIQHYGLEEISIGDYVLSGGEMAALTLLDAAVRLLPGVMGGEESHLEESFSLNTPGGSENTAGLLEYPHYTRPPCWEGLSVPEVLMSGNHEQIKRWRWEKAVAATRERRPDIWKKLAKTSNAK